jgi:hypothetical protein
VGGPPLPPAPPRPQESGEQAAEELPACGFAGHGRFLPGVKLREVYALVEAKQTPRLNGPRPLCFPVRVSFPSQTSYLNELRLLCFLLPERAM